MRHSMLPGVLLVPLILSGGCASFSGAPGSPEPSATDPYVEIREAIADRPAVPGAAEMLPTVALVTFPFRRSGRIRRDTIQGIGRVASWLDRLVDQTAGTAHPFRMVKSEILICDGAAVERGEYALGGAPLQAPDIGSRSVRSAPEYLALWRPMGEEWRLERLWLSPGSSVRVARLAQGCKADRNTLAGLSLGAAVGAGAGPELDAAATELRETGYDDQSVPGGTLPALRLWARVDVLPSTSVVLEYDMTLGDGMAAVDTAAVYRRAVDFNVNAYTFSVLLQTRVGPVWLAAGPAATVTVSDFTVKVASPSPYTRTNAQTSRTVGALARGSLRLPLSRHIRAVGSLGYLYLGDVEVTDGLQTSVGVGGLNGVIGVEWHP